MKGIMIPKSPTQYSGVMCRSYCTGYKEGADDQLESDKKEHKKVVREIKADIIKIDCLDNYYDMSRAITALVYKFKQKYEVK